VDCGEWSELFLLFLHAVNGFSPSPPNVHNHTCRQHHSTADPSAETNDRMPSFTVGCVRTFAVDCCSLGRPATFLPSGDQILRTQAAPVFTGHQRVVEITKRVASTLSDRIVVKPLPSVVQ
jgi:hypothetical protein